MFSVTAYVLFSLRIIWLETKDEKKQTENRSSKEKIKNWSQNQNQFKVEIVGPNRKRRLFRFYHFIFLDVDECPSASCHVNADCANTDGSYNCTCKPGYTGNGHSCTGEIYYSGLLHSVKKIGLNQSIKQSIHQF